MNRVLIIGLCIVLLLLPAVLVTTWASAAGERLREAEEHALLAPEKVAVAAHANEAYCTPDLKKVLRRVLQSCGLIQGRSGRGCKPTDAKSVATMSGDDFNSLFIPMADRGGIIQFDQGSDDLEDIDKALVDKVFSERRGASYFFVVSRASPEGAITKNRELSRRRAEQVMGHLETTFKDPDLARQVGLLWLGEEYAQLDPSFCNWQRSGTTEICTPEELNRSSFITWIDCRL